MILYLFILAINFSVLLSVTEEQREAIESITKDVNKAPDFTLYSIESKDYSWVKSILIEISNANIEYKEKYNNFAFNLNQLIQNNYLNLNNDFLDSWSIELDQDNLIIKATNNLDSIQFLYNVLDDEFSIFTSNENNLSLDDTITLSDLNDKVVLINFWATWCGPCRMEIPDLNKLYQDYNDKGFEILSISISDTKEQLLKFKNAYNIFYPILYGDSKTMMEIQMNYGGVYSIPMSFLIDKNREVARVYPGAIMSQYNPAMHVDLITYIEKLLVE